MFPVVLDCGLFGTRTADDLRLPASVTGEAPLLAAVQAHLLRLGDPDPAATALVGAAAGAAVGYGISQASVSQNAHYRPYGEPVYSGRPVYRGRAYRRPPPGYYRGW